MTVGGTIHFGSVLCNRYGYNYHHATRAGQECVYIWKVTHVTYLCKGLGTQTLHLPALEPCAGTASVYAPLWRTSLNYTENTPEAWFYSAAYHS